MQKGLAISDRAKKLLKKHKNETGIVYCFSDHDTAFSQNLINVITEMYEQGIKPETIAAELNRKPIEILIALLHQADQDQLMTAFATRR